ncbi:peptidoglycan recognition protein 1-like [Macrosteles quadrilineatus]|uniref:peptidoglycan recognition protein 1-like n=1 Tax=Macrosteles quadrilineatus TaxID=74068 RepID=UPI0023E0FEEA|nr:peptidoglycan recognition protein 1-like [Macrosteles quadrilineatus]
MDFEDFLANKMDILHLIKPQTDQKAAFAASLAMQRAYTPPPPGIDYLYRDDWMAFPPVRKQLLMTPVRHLRLCQTGGKPCEDKDDCIARVRRIQEKHVVAECLEDIAYNFLVDHEGRVYEGRGWNVQAQRPPKYEYLKYFCLDICLIGNWRKNPVPDKAIKAVGDLKKYGVASNYIEKRHVLLGYREEAIVKEETKRKLKNKNKTKQDENVESNLGSELEGEWETNDEDEESI